MRKIVFKRQKKRLQRRNQFIVGFILVFLMITSTLGFAFQGSSKGNFGENNGNANQNIVDYNGFSFENINGFWVLGNFVFRNLPNDVPEIGEGLKGLDNYQNKIVYIKSENVGAESEIIVNLGQIAEDVQSACLEGGERDCEKNQPVKTCEDNFIIIEESSKTEIVQDRNCVFIHGSADNLIKLTDQFLFKIIGIK